MSALVPTNCIKTCTYSVLVYFVRLVCVRVWVGVKSRGKYEYSDQKLNTLEKFCYFFRMYIVHAHSLTQHQQHKEVHVIYQRYRTDNTSLYTLYKRWKMLEFYAWSSIPLIYFLLLLLLNNTVLNEVSILEMFDIKKKSPHSRKVENDWIFFHTLCEFCLATWQLYSWQFPSFSFSFLSVSHGVHMVSFILIFFIFHLSHARTNFSRFVVLYFHFRNECFACVVKYAARSLCHIDIFQSL